MGWLWTNRWDMGLLRIADENLCFHDCEIEHPRLALLEYVRGMIMSFVAIVLPWVQRVTP